ncbi:MAG TPA: hypothetical protein VHS31_17810, partial [Tepidisphaeraceae bacterium]|nr:hypothetical protein [Tepidisphaeraceae bacterium]
QLHPRNGRAFDAWGDRIDDGLNFRQFWHETFRSWLGLYFCRTQRMSSTIVAQIDPQYQLQETA